MGELISNKIRDVQLIELEILIEVTRICRENNIEYFLDSGTALGAVRHKGFIPWDDDVDIGMTRASYDRFIDKAENQLGENYFLQTRQTDKNYPYSFAKVRKNGTAMIEWNTRNLKMHHGIWIDIFPYDFLPNDRIKREKQIKKSIRLHRIFLFKTMKERTSRPRKSIKWVCLSIIRKILRFSLLVIPVSILEHLVNETFKEFNEIETDNITCHCYGGGCVFNRKDLLPTGKIEFEGCVFPIANNPDAYLKNLYGDYIILPPVEERNGHSIYHLEY